MDMNIVVLSGRLTNDPIVNEYKNGHMARFNLAVNGVNDKVDFVPITAWNESAKTIGKYLKKGSRISVEGSINCFSTKKEDGTWNNGFNVSLHRFYFLDSKKDKSLNEEMIEEKKTLNESKGTNKNVEYVGSLTNNDFLEIGADELPF